MDKGVYYLTKYGRFIFLLHENKDGVTDSVDTFDFFNKRMSSLTEFPVWRPMGERLNVPLPPFLKTDYDVGDKAYYMDNRMLT